MKKIITPQARQLADALSGLGLEIREEHGDGFKHVDIYLPKSQINIEVDGRHHLTNPFQILSDMSRAHFSELDHVSTIHIHNDEIDTNLERIAVAIAEAAKIQEARLKGHHVVADLSNL